MEMPIWEYNGKFYLKINDKKVHDHRVRNVAHPVESTGFKKDVPYMMDLTFPKYDFVKGCEQITGYTISQIKKMCNANI